MVEGGNGVKLVLATTTAAEGAEGRWPMRHIIASLKEGGKLVSTLQMGA